MPDEYTDPPGPLAPNGKTVSPAGECLNNLVDWNSPAWDSHGRTPHPLFNKRRRPANPLKRDPSRTLTLRRAFCTRLRKKFALLRGRIIRLVVDEDALGLSPLNPLGNSNRGLVASPSSNAFCATGVGGGIDATRSPGESTAGALYERATTAARGVLRKFSEAYGKVTDRPVLRQLKKAGDYLGKKTKDLYGTLETRYGRKQAMAIMASAQIVGWGALGVGAVIGVPLYLPGVSIWGTLPAVALAEGYLQASRGLGKVKVALTGNEETDDYGTLGPRGVAGEARKLVSDLREAYLVYLRSQAPKIRGVLAANCNPGQLRDATSGRCGPGVGVDIPRAEMPQIRGGDVTEFVRWVRSQGVGVGEETIDPGDLAPTQREFRQERVDAIPTEKLRDPLIVSRDSYVLDGTHRWVKAWQDDRPTLAVLRLNLDLDDALDLMRRFPGARFVKNAFCPTGEGGGIDPSCSPGDLGSPIVGLLRSELSDNYDAEGRQLTFTQAVRSGANNPLAGDVGDRYYTQTLGHDPKVYERIKRLLVHHGLGGEGQAGVDTQIVATLTEDSPDGRMLRDIARTETTLLREYYAGHEEREQQEARRIRSNMEGVYDEREIKDRIETDTGGPPPMLYRGGELRPGKLEAWTTNPRGAQSQFLGDTKISFRVDHRRDIGQLLDEGYVSVGGIGRMVGASGESEVALVKLQHPLPSHNLSLRSPTANAGLGTPSPLGRWAATPDHEKVKKFQEWLRQQYEDLLDDDDEEALWAKFVEDGYRKGAGRAYDDTTGKTKQAAASSEAGLALPPGGTTSLEFKLGGKSQFLRTTLGAPERVSKVKLLAGRAFDELEDVTADMSLKMSRVLADGLVKGEGPATVARALTDQVGLGQTRAETIAQTEIIRAHAEGQLDGLEDMGVEEVGVAVEWEVTEDEALCELCAEMDGVVLTIDEARGMLPRHPNCRCCWVPANVGEDDKDQQRTRGEIIRAIKASRAEAGDDEEDDDWGPAVPVSKDRPESILNHLAAALNSFCATGQGGGVDPSCGAGGGMTRQEQAVKEAYTAAYGPSSKTLKPRERSAAVERYKAALRDWTAAGEGQSGSLGASKVSAAVTPLSQETARAAVRLTETFRRLDREQGGHNFVHLGHLRAAHPELSREQLDVALRYARQEGALTLSPAEGRHGITAHDRATALEEDNPATPGRKDLMLYVSERRGTTNAFCPTGPGGGVNPHCSPGGHDLSTGAGLTAHLQAAQGQHGLTALGLRKIQHLNPQGIQSGVLYVYGSPNKVKADALAAKLRGILPAQTIIKVRTGISAKTLSSTGGVPANVPSPHPPQSSRLPTVPYTHEVKWETGKAEPGTLNGVDFAPAPPKFWEHTSDKDIKEPDPVRPISRASVMIQEPDGRVWIVQPTNGFGQRNHTLPGGTIEPGLTHQQNALKEVWEETGLQVEITGHLGDFEDSNNGRTGRLYIGRRVGGAP